MAKSIAVPAPRITPITLGEAKPLFEEWQIGQGIVEATRKNYRSNLARLTEKLGDGKYLHEITAQDVAKYLGYYADKGEGTKNNAKNRLKGFMAWARIARHISPFQHDDPAADLKNVKYEVPQKPYIEAKLWPDVLNLAGSIHPIYRAYVAVGLYLMGRGPSELRTLLIGDVKPAGDTWRIGVTRVKTKSAMDPMAVCGELRLELTNYLMWYNAWTLKNMGMPLQPGWHLFPNSFYHTGGMQKWPINPTVARSAQSILNITERVLRDFGYPTRNEDGTRNRWGGTHAWRRFGARALFDELLDNGSGYDGALAVVREMLGHKSNATTEHYLNLSLDRIRRDKAVTQHDGFMFRHNAPGAEEPVQLATRQLPASLVGGVLLGGADESAIEQATATVLELPVFRNAA